MEEGKDKPHKRIKIEVVEEDKEETKLEDDNSLVTKEVADKKEDTSTEKPEESDVKVKEEKPLNQPASEKLPFWILFFSFLIGLSLGAGLVGGVFYYRDRVDSVFSGNSGTPSPSPDVNNTPDSETPMPSPEEEIDYSKYKVQILNGSGTKGAASTVEKLLNDVGFTQTVTGNSSSYNFTDTEVSLKKDVPEAVYEKIKESLENYTVEKADENSNSSGYDIIITVGKVKP